jgi:hypothetical protein
VKATLRMNPQEAQAMATSNSTAPMAGNAQAIALRQTEPATGIQSQLRALPAATWHEATKVGSRKKKSGLSAILEELPGTTGLLIGIGLGLGIAAGAVIAVLLLR